MDNAFIFIYGILLFFILFIYSLNGVVSSQFSLTVSVQGSV